MRYEIIIPGKPIPLKRHRMSGTKAYDPQARLKVALRKFILRLENMPKRLENPLFVKIRLNMPLPKSYSKKRALKTLGLPHTQKPDLSNLIKFYEDTFNKFFWTDDAIIAGLLVDKTWATTGQTHIIIEEYEKEKMDSLFNT